MMRPRALVFASVLGLGCGASDEGDGDSSGASTSSSAGSTTAPTASTTDASAGESESASLTDASASESASSGASSPETGGETSASSEAGSETSSPEGSSSEGGGDACLPDRGDDACRECVKTNCCDAWAACANDEICACTVDCHLAGASLGSCKNMCGGESDAYSTLYFCGQMYCLGTCEWDCC